MKEVTGIIDHRILLNFRIDPEVMKKNLPEEFTPKVVGGYAIGGICQVSLSEMRAKGMPSIVGTGSHNAAHRIAVDSSQGEGVYVTRRDTNSWLNTMSGGRVFPGVYSKANFDVSASGDLYSVRIENKKKELIMSISAEVVSELPEGSVFESTEEVSDFFKTGNIGWSSKEQSNQFDAIELKTVEWGMEPLKVKESFSAYFSNTSIFPKGSVEFDSAMIMRNLKHSWVSRDNLCELCC
ncbi:DUF2071 domain-containing protein [Akkermansiaceae bacterium]|jgi:uncharacterized protein YqjF (DUF2071 family)|nr:DUF2071 domain-containing protein [Akkermansiaceae bacterium]|tara:strand:- start:64 stop:777 length:714 start_codon:yes stop_codon:yes gene_type:complete